ncbi:MAG: ComF family protein [Gammaproteobacteria bacterium]|nr:ComF family protein [Gammaproteobacteria bacterium]MDH3767257.1 ComF family protein [Gammaproteobacteria bacterium]
MTIIRVIPGKNPTGLLPAGGAQCRIMRRQYLTERLDCLSKWLLPPTCVVCGGNSKHRDLCHDCALALPWNDSCCARCALPLAVTAAYCGKCATRPPPWSQAKSPFVYDFPVDSLLRQLKFSRRLPNGRVLGELTAEWVASFDESKPDLLIPVPLHWRRQLGRQFNQATEIARPIQRRLNIPISERLCKRSHYTPQQSGLSAGARKRNLRNAFVVRGDVSNTHIAIIDDIMTTGSTLAELSKALLRAGAEQVDVWTVARVTGAGLSYPPPVREGDKET